MKKHVIALLTLVAIIFTGTSLAAAHPGRLDSNGGHNCSDKSKAKGLCTGYHYHDANGNPIYPGEETNSEPEKPVQNPKPAAPSQPSIKIIIDGETQTLAQKPTVIQGTTMVPFRSVFEKLGANVQWDSNSKKVTAQKEDTKIVLTIGNKVGYVNNTQVHLPVPAYVLNGNTMVPLRFISETLGASVKWDSQNDTITITTK